MHVDRCGTCGSQVLMFKICGILEFSKIEFFNFSAIERINGNFHEIYSHFEINVCEICLLLHLHVFSARKMGKSKLGLREGDLHSYLFQWGRGEGGGYIESGNHFPFKELEGAIRYLRVALYFLIPPYTFFKSYRLG